TVRINRFKDSFQRGRSLQNAGGRNWEHALPERGLREIVEIAAEVIVGRAVNNFGLLAGMVYDRTCFADALRPAILAEDSHAPGKRRLDRGRERAGRAVVEFNKRRRGVARFKLEGTRF